jgi:hypothetical protein
MLRWIELHPHLLAVAQDFACTHLDIVHKDQYAYAKNICCNLARLDDGIDLLHDDNSVLKILNFAKKHNFAEIFVKHKGHESIPVNQRSGPGNKEKLADEVLY